MVTEPRKHQLEYLFSIQQILSNNVERGTLWRLWWFSSDSPCHYYSLLQIPPNSL